MTRVDELFWRALCGIAGTPTKTKQVKMDGHDPSQMNYGEFNDSGLPAAEVDTNDYANDYANDAAAGGGIATDENNVGTDTRQAFEYSSAAAPAAATPPTTTEQAGYSDSAAAGSITANVNIDYRTPSAAASNLQQQQQQVADRVDYGSSAVELGGGVENIHVNEETITSVDKAKAENATAADIAGTETEQNQDVAATYQEETNAQDNQNESTNTSLVDLFEQSNDGDGDNDVSTKGSGGSMGSVVDLLDSDEEEEELQEPAAPTASGSVGGGDVNIPLPSSPPPAAPWTGNAAINGNVAAAGAAAAAPPVGDDDSDSDIEIIGTTAVPVQPPQAQHQPGQHGAAAAAAAREHNMPDWMVNAATAAHGQAAAAATGAQRGRAELSQNLQALMNERQRAQQLQNQLQAQVRAAASSGQNRGSAPTYVELEEGHVPTWAEPVPYPKPSPPPPPPTDVPRAFRLSLLTCTEFTISPMPHPQYWDHTGRSLNLAGLRIPIKKMAKEHGGATFDRAADDDTAEAAAGSGSGRWRIPLGAYRSIHTYLIQSDPRTYVEGIPPYKLQIATLGKQRKDKAYPSVETLIDSGVPAGIAKALAPYQRGGVDFVLDRDGCALIADEMGLGKTIQAIAAMSKYEKEWPLIVFSPSSARYHWEVEFRHWLGAESVVNKPPEESKGGDNDDDSAKITATDEKKDDDVDEDPQAYTDFNAAAGSSSSSSSTSERPQAESTVPNMTLLRDSQINVLTSSRDPILPTPQTRVVICSYGLAPNLIQAGSITPGMFKCAIVDESHMLKNKNTKRSKTILPILLATQRCILLSGTPALSRPMELWPQLSVLGHKKGWWVDEADYVGKYVKKDGETTDGGALAELHTLLTSTVMIRRMKVDMLKNLPKKERQNAKIRIKDEGLKREFARSMELLREGKGTLGELARQHKKEEDEQKKAAGINEGDDGNGDRAGDNSTEDQGATMGRPSVNSTRPTDDGTIDLEAVRDAINKEANDALQAALNQCQQMVQADSRYVTQEHKSQALNYLFQRVSPQIDENRTAQLSALTIGGTYNGLKIVDQSEESTRKTILNHLYSLTGKAKVPLVVKMLNKWLNDPTRGKLCIFAHHIDILDAITEGAGLSNSADSRRKFIRIDGSTNPKHRQEQMMKFQSDPTVRIAILGITAAGVAVTLTAASTVWFAELFWTPAIMIQAEDRCHRIGQQATVRCLYLIGKGTLDEVLWKLIEKKFRQLGEFVEGKENLDIVVHRTFSCGMEAIQSDEEDEEDSADGDSDADGSGTSKFKRLKTMSFGELADEDSIQHDIEELAKEEEAMLHIGLDDDDENGESSTNNTNGAAVASAASSSAACKDGQNEKSSEVGQSESVAICLIDDSDEEEDNDNKGSESNVDGNKENSIVIQQKKMPPPKPSTKDVIDEFIKRGNGGKIHFDNQTRLSSPKVYKMLFFGPQYGLMLVRFEGRVVVTAADIHTDGSKQDVRPGPGDFLMKVNHLFVPRGVPMENVTGAMRKAMQKTPVELHFVVDPVFAKFFCENVLPTSAAARRANAAGGAGGVGHLNGGDAVIELLDDD